MRLLVLTHTFPPSWISNAKRPFYLVRGFLEAGWQVDVISSTLGMRVGEPETVAEPNLRLRRPFDPMLQFMSNALERQRIYRMGALAASALLWPDIYVNWSRKALQLCRREISKYDRVLTFVLPGSLLLAGARAGLVGPHWVFDYQESVTPQYRRHLRRSPLQRMLVPVLTKLERRTLHQAGRVVFTAETNRRTYIQEGLVPEGRTTHIPYFFDANVFGGAAPAVNTSPGFQIVYFGTFDWRGERSPETFLRALSHFLGKHPEARAHTQFLFHGNWLTEHNSFVEQLGLRDIVSLKPSLSYQQYLEKLRKSPILLLVVSAAHNLFMPSKIVDYFGARRPILGFVPRESEMRRVLESAGMAAFASDEFDVAGGIAALEKLWDAYRSGKLDCDGEKVGFWSSDTQVPRYLELVSAAGA